MLKTRNILITIILNVAILFFVSIMQEYYSVATKLQDVDSVVDTSIDTAIQVSMMGEDFFSSTSGSGSYSQLQLYRGNEWVGSNLFAVCKYYTEHGDFPTASVDITQEEAYKWLYGETGGTRKPTAEFKAFYDAVGKKATSSMYVWDNPITKGNIVTASSVPTLCQTGLFLDSIYNVHNPVTGALKAESLAKVKKEGNGGGSYYLSPYSLGVTYLDPRVLKPVIIAHLEQSLRYNKGTTPADWQNADGCIPTDVYEGGTHVSHTLGSNERIVNDGIFEIDMNSLDIQIDYKMVDMYDPANYAIVNFLEGATPYELDLTKRPLELKGVDTSGGTGNRLVAKVTVSMDIHIPYTSPIMQWFRRTRHTGGEDHLDVRSTNLSGALEDTKYTYITYTAITR